MGMFDNYNNIDINYIPDNVSDKSENAVYKPTTLPEILYNIKGNRVAYTWNLGDTFIWQIGLNHTIKVEINSIIYHTTGAGPDTLTKGSVGQKAYNLVDMYSWQCVKSIEGEYIWKQDEHFTYPINGEVNIALEPIIEGSLTFELYNFRREHLKTFTEFNGNKVLVNINTELNEELQQGVYYGIIKNINDCESRILDEVTIFIK